MLSREDFIRYSLEINLFFLRLAKEHALFLAASLPPRDLQVSYQLIAQKNALEVLLRKAVSLSQGIISPEVLASKELVTDLTLQAEEKTQFLTGIPIDMNITKMELQIKPGSYRMEKPTLFEEVFKLNQQAIAGLKTAVSFKEELLADILSCKAFSYVYPHMLEHVIEETRFFTNLLINLQNMDDIDSIKATLVALELKFNWNHIMEEHAEFIRGYLDPSEAELFKTADAFAMLFEELPKNISTPKDISESFKATTSLRDFKKAGTAGILACKIKSVIPPLLGDHVLREANHYLRLLNALNN